MFAHLPIRIAVTGTIIVALTAPGSVVAAAPTTAPIVSYTESAFAGSAYKPRAEAMPNGLTVAISRDLKISAAAYLAQGDAAAQAVQTVDSLIAAGVKVLGSSIDGTALTVNVATATDAAVVATAGATAVRGKANDREDSGDTMLTSASGTILNGSGYFVTGSDGLSSQCSVGFNGFTSAGDRRFVTAGHCFREMVSAAPVRMINQTHPGSGESTGSVIGSLAPETRREGAPAPGFDVAQVTVLPGHRAAAAATTWGAVEPWGVDSTESPDAAQPLPITGQSAAIVGAKVCKSGSRTGWSCGVIVAVDIAADRLSVDGKSVLFSVNSIRTTVCALPGDSGGPVMTGSIALGIASGSTSATACDSTTRSSYFPLVSAAGKASITSAYGPDWELAVTVETPKLVAPKGGKVTAPWTLAGTVADANTDTKVKLFMDESSQAALMVSAADGTFELPMPMLSAGNHHYRVVATWGNHSHSADAVGTIIVGSAAIASSAAIVGSTAIAPPKNELRHFSLRELAHATWLYLTGSSAKAHAVTNSRHGPSR